MKIRDSDDRGPERTVAEPSLDLQIVQMAVLQLAKAVAEGKIKMTMAYLDKLIRLEAFLSNEPDSRREIVLGELRGKTDDELEEMVRREMKLLAELR